MSDEIRKLQLSSIYGRFGKGDDIMPAPTKSNVLQMHALAVDAANACWIQNPDEVVAFARELDASGWFDDTKEAIDYFANPRDLEPEHRRWALLGRPNFKRNEREWEVILDGVFLSPEAEDLLDCNDGDHVLTADFEEDDERDGALGELVEAGLVEVMDDDIERVPFTAAGRVYLRELHRRP